MKWHKELLIWFGVMWVFIFIFIDTGYGLYANLIMTTIMALLLIAIIFVPYQLMKKKKA